MPVADELLEILVCPETKQPLRLAEAAELESLNGKVSSGELRNRGGERVAKTIAAGLVREDGKVLYVIDEDIPVMLVDESIEL